MPTTGGETGVEVQWSGGGWSRGGERGGDEGSLINNIVAYIDVHGGGTFHNTFHFNCTDYL